MSVVKLKATIEVWFEVDTEHYPPESRTPAAVAYREQEHIYSTPLSLLRLVANNHWEVKVENDPE